MAIPEDIKGEWVVGLNPDDRMPNDWLRMVARVFASYRKKPLKESIVAYIDGLNLSLISKVPTEIIIGITPGQSFVDDQFIGFIEDSQLKIPTTAIVYGVKYAIVLHYRWVNQMPPQEPNFEIIQETQVNNEEMLVLGYMICTDDGLGGCILTLIDDKKPWYLDMIDAAAGNTEVDGPELLPYVVQIKSGTGPEEGGSEFPDGDPLDEEGTIDIGWSVDFHNSIGNAVNYNTRLHTDKVNDGLLYINGNQIITNINGLNGPVDPGDLDPNGAGDVYIEIKNNTVVFDRFDDSVPTANEGSDSGKACMSLAVEKTTGGILSSGGSSWCYDLASGGSSIQNRSDFNDVSTAINTLTLTNAVDIVTINGNPIWHSGNLTSTGQSIMFLGYFSSHPTDRPLLPGQTTPDAIEEGDMYFNTNNNSYYYMSNGQWAQVARTVPGGTYEFVATEGQRIIAGVEYNPDYFHIYVDGIKLTRGEFIATDGINIELTASKPAFKGEEIISIHTIFGAELLSGRLKDLTDVELIQLQDGETIVWDASISRWVNQVAGGTSGNFVNKSGDTMTGSLMIEGGLTTYHNNAIMVLDDTSTTDARSSLSTNKLIFASNVSSDVVMNIGRDLGTTSGSSNLGYNSALAQWEINGNRILDTIDIVPDANELTKGIVRQATNAEADAGILDNVYVTPSDVGRLITSMGGGTPTGGIIMWSGALNNIPSGWVLCDGSSGTPNLSGTFVRGASTTLAVGSTGGSASSALNEHTHGIRHKHDVFNSSSETPTDGSLKWTTSALLNHSPALLTPTSVPPSNPSVDHFMTGANDEPVIIDIPDQAFDSEATGQTVSESNLPPYYALAYIMKI